MEVQIQLRLPRYSTSSTTLDNNFNNGLGTGGLSFDGDMDIVTASINADDNYENDGSENFTETLIDNT